MDFVKDPHEVQMLKKTKAWAQDMVENGSSDTRGKRALKRFVQGKHIQQDIKSLVNSPQSTNRQSEIASPEL